MNVRVVMPTSLSPLRIVLFLVVAILHMSCESKQSDTPKPSPPAATASAEPGILELAEGSTTFAHLQTDRATLRPIRTVLKAQAGKILANENRLAHLSARVPGRIVAVYANFGDRVKEGDRLLLLDSPAFGEAQLEYRKARTMLSVTEKALERAAALLDRGAIGAGEHQRREADYENVRADLHEAEEKLHLLGMTEREIQRLAVKTLPHAEVARVSLRAPFSGAVIERNATIGEVVDPNTTLFTVADLSTVWVRADFPEQQAGRLKTGLTIEVRVSAMRYSRTLAAQNRRPPGMESSTSSSPICQQTPKLLGDCCIGLPRGNPHRCTPPRSNAARTSSAEPRAPVPSSRHGSTPLQ